MGPRKLAALAFFVGLCLSPAVALSAPPCTASSSTLCLTGRRFTAEVQWKDFQGNTGSGHAVSLTSDTGYFWFFSDTNVELVVKVLDGRALNGHFWVFYGALSNVEYTLTVRDLETGDIRVYENPSGQFASTGDTSAFPPDSLSLASTKRANARAAGRAPIDESPIKPAATESASACTPGTANLCLGGGRFKVAAAWKDFQGNTGVGQAVALTSDTGYFWFFSSTNVELVVKALDGRALNDHFWVFYGALSNVAYTLTVTDTVTGIVRTYENPASLFASVGDTSAFGKPTTFELIDGAVVKGEITDETALLDKVYAFFGDARLPQAYAGTAPGEQQHGILSDVANRWSALSSQTQQALRPFLIPPTDPGSWFAQSSAFGTRVLEHRNSVQSDWTRIPTTHCWVWYRSADAGAETAANNLAAEMDIVWNAETGLMKHEPVPDASIPAPNGGDGLYDVYVLPSFRDPKLGGADGVLTPYPDQPGDQARAAYTLIRISSAATPEGARWVLSHEFFHAIAASFKNGLNGWLNEATATWMEDYVYPKQILNKEHLDAGPYFTGGYKTSFDQPSDGGYQDYVFLFYIAHRYSSEVIHQIWNNVETMGNLQSIQAAISGGFAARWPEFALDCWDQPEVDNFNQWDPTFTGLVGGRANPYIAFSHGAGEETLPARSVSHLAMDYAYIEVIDDAIQRVEIQTQPVMTNGGDAKTQVWIKFADGSTRVDDWTGKSRVVFCRDKAAEAVTQLLILYTNSGQGDSVGWGVGKVKADTAGCGGFRGTVQESRHSTQAAAGQEVDESMDSTVTFLPDPGLSGGYYLAAITMVYNFVGHDDTTSCTLTIGPVTHTDSFQPGDADLSLNGIVIDSSTQPPTYSATGNYGFPADAKGECPGKPPGTVPGIAGGVWWTVPPGFFPVNPDGSLSGNSTDTQPGSTTVWTWKLTPD